MSDEKVGYGKPPTKSRFRKGVCPNPLGRGKRVEDPLVKAVDDILSGKVPFREGGKLRRASRGELSVTRLVASALNGNVKDAAELLRLRTQAGPADTSSIIIKISGGLPEHWSQSDEQSR